MNRSMRTILAATAAASTTVLLAATGAQADTVRHSDLRHDVQHFDSGDLTPAPHASDPDITRATVRHGAHRVVIRLHARDVSRRTDMGFAAILIPGGAYDLVVFPEEPRASRLFTDGSGDVNCRGIFVHRSVRRDLVRFSVPRRCLGSPRWVRVGAALDTVSPSIIHSRFDDAFGGRHADDDHLVLSRRLHRS